MGAVTSGAFLASEAKRLPSSLPPREALEVKSSDVLIARANGSKRLVGAGVVVPDSSRQRLIFPDLMYRLVSDLRVLDPHYLGLVMTAPMFRRQVESAMRSTSGQFKISKADLGEFTIPVPALADQRRIVEVLEGIGEQERAIDAAISKLRTLRHSTLARSIGPSKSSDRMSSSDFPRVRDVGEVRMGKQLSPSSRDFGEQLPYLRVANVLDGWIDYSDIKTMWFSESERKVHRLLPGDILLNEGQSLDLVGRSAIFRGHTEVVYFQNTLVRFRPCEGLSPEYAQAVFSYWLTSGVFAGIAKQTTSIAHLGGERFANLPFPMISAGEQERIGRMLHVWDEKISGEESALAKLRTLRAGLINDLLSGRADRQAVA